MQKILSLFTASLLLLSSQVFTASAEENEVREDSLSAIADSLGAKTDLLNVPNYYHDEERPVPIASYAEWLDKGTNAECGLNPQQAFDSAVNKGNCLGITLVEVLCHNGVFAPSDVQQGAETLSDVVYNDDINKLLTDYQALQVHTEYELFDHYLITALSYNEQVDRTLDIAEKCMAEKRYFALFFQTHKMFHAVTGMGIVDGSWQFGDSTYDRCILTHDSNGTDSDGNTGFNEKGCIYVDSTTRHIYIPAYDIDSDDEMLIGAIDDDTLLNYKGALSPSQSIDTDVSDIKKVTLNSTSRISYDISFFKDGNSLPLGDYLTGLNSRIYYTKADKIVARTSRTKSSDSKLSNYLSVQDTKAKRFIETYEQPSEVTVHDNICSIRSTNGEELRWRIEYCLNDEIDNTEQCLFAIYGRASDIEIVQEKNGFLLRGCINDEYGGCTTLGLKTDENGRKAGGFGNQYVYYFNSVQNVFIEFENDRELGLYIDPDGDGEFTDKVRSGDINCDGRIDAIDASKILSKYSWLSTHYDLFLDMSQTTDSLECTFMNYDYNSDGKIDASDATAVLVEYSRLSTALSA